MSKGQLTHVESRAVKNDECDNFEVILQMQIFRENLISRMKLLKQSVSLNKVYVGSSSSIQWSVSPKMSLITSLTSWIPRIMVPETHLRTGPVQSPGDALRAGSGPRSSGLHRPVVPLPTQADRWHRLQLQTVSLLVTYSKQRLKDENCEKVDNRFPALNTQLTSGVPGRLSTSSWLLCCPLTPVSSTMKSSPCWNASAATVRTTFPNWRTFPISWDGSRWQHWRLF